MSDFVRQSIAADDMLRTTGVVQALRYLLRVWSICVVPEIVFQRPDETI